MKKQPKQRLSNLKIKTQQIIKGKSLKKIKGGIVVEEDILL